MIAAAQISKRQLVALQALWSAHAAREISTAGDPREQRLSAVGNIVGRELHSFKDLTEGEAMRAIDSLKKSLGQPTGRSARKTRAAAQAAGTEGRGKLHNNAVTIAGADDIALVQNALVRLGWDQNRFTAWLRSPHGPLNGRDQLRTIGDCNRVWSALKPMLKRAGLWNQSTSGDAA